MSPKIKRYAILTPFDKADVVAGIAALAKLDVDVVPTSSGALIVRELPVPQYDEWDIRNITGEMDSEESGEGGDNAPYVAAMFSKLTPYGVVLLDVDLGEDVGIETGVSGLVRARRFQNGEPGETISSGLLLNVLDPIVERVVLGQKSPRELNAVHALDVAPEQVIQALKDAQKGDELHEETQPRRGFFSRRKGSNSESDGK